ncbi:ADP-ribosylation factor-binding protein GGA1 isoform X1 [Maylandia zebra]|uniref:ADP-ribosylation factor-binding protein GGA1-like n=4 Tax=Haplochromini TaxID=319058 RepID=A0A3B4FAG8_9CICH|nr:ADP-ribosylation factor-binding protein GGA1 isoform X1 [Maylandia zebra]XP_005735869.1 PREDICTED: ADP-ribosylation factor-binding protein GGA1-like [Pundamilia nyererei]XP_026025810.1 ADP-ribosylation factor-binding protein GGA1-like isoform X1 [Astatotilapia calliptera]
MAAAAPPDEASLQSRINKATNPLNKEIDWDSIKGFCDQLENEPEGPQLATRLLAHKIQSPQEWEAMQALTVLETCMKNCGKRFHSEVGKFRFLNELIKVVSPKYLGARAPEAVKKKVLEMIYSWTVRLPDETKILEAYQMLKKQGIVKQDPVLPVDKPLPPPPPRAKSAIFEDEEKSKTLSRLLNSTHPEDLRAANKLIKEMVQEDQKRVEKVSKRVNAIQEVKESVSLLSQLLEGYNKESCSQSNQELIKDLYNRCEKMRPTLFRLASDTEDNDEALADILQANDSLTQVINQYRQLVKGEDVSKDVINSSLQPGNSSSALVDLTGLNISANTAPSNTDSSSLQLLTQNMGLSLLDDELMSLGLNVTENGDSQNTFQSSDITEVSTQSAPASVLLPAVVQKPRAPPVEGATAPPKAMEELDLLGKALLQQSLPPESQQVKWDKLQPQSRVPLRDLQAKSSSKPTPAATSTSTSSSATAPGASSVIHSEQSDAVLLSNLTLTVTDKASLPTADTYDSISLADVTVPLEIIKPSTLLPVTVFDKHSLRVLFTFARDCPPSRPDVLVVIISMLSSAPIPVTNIRFQAAVPRVMKVKLQPPSSTELPAFNPILSPAAITQILLLANPHKEKVRLRYKLTFNLGDKSHDESGDVDQFPPPNTWGNL